MIWGSNKLKFCLVIHLLQTSGGFVLPDAVCGQSHFLPFQHLSVTHCLSALMSINEGNDLCAACHV